MVIYYELRKKALLPFFFYLDQQFRIKVTVYSLDVCVFNYDCVLVIGASTHFTALMVASLERQLTTSSYSFLIWGERG